MIFGHFMHPVVVVKNLGVWFDANFSGADNGRNICKTCFFQMHDLWWVRQYLTDQAVILVANVLVHSCIIGVMKDKGHLSQIMEPNKDHVNPFFGFGKFCSRLWYIFQTENIHDMQITK